MSDPKWAYERIFTSVEFGAREHRRVEAFLIYAADDDQMERLSDDGWVERFNDYLAGVDSGEIEEPHISNRRLEWDEFARIVGRHVEEYTVPQYGDAPDDPLSSYSEDDIVLQIKRYVNRLGTNARGPAEARRDLLKLAHYAGVLYMVTQKVDLNPAGE